MNPRTVRSAVLGVLLTCVGAGRADDSRPGEPDPSGAVRGPGDPRIGVVNAFLNAVRARDPVGLLGATSHRAPDVAQPRNRPLFKAIRDQKLTKDELKDLAGRFEGYSFNSFGHASAGKLRINLAKPVPGGAWLTRTVTISYDRDRGGWKVADFGEPREARPAVILVPRRGLIPRRGGAPPADGQAR